MLGAKALDPGAPVTIISLLRNPHQIRVANSSNSFNGIALLNGYP